jgi:3-hydroxyacyl-CoA dehydrogenase
VHWFFPSPADQATCLAALDAGFDRLQRAGQLTPELREACRARLRAGDDAAVVAGITPLVRADGPDAALRVVTRRGELGAALSVAPSARATELALLAEEAPEAIAVAVALLRRIGLPPVLVGGRPVLGAQVMQAGGQALAWMAAVGVPPRAIGTAIENFGARRPELAGTADLTPPREMGGPEIERRWLGAMANEGVRLLEAGIARRPSDIDQALVAGHFFPRWQAGPMYQADRRGLLVLRADLRLWAQDDAVWQPAPLLDRLIGDGMRLSALDG